MNNTSILPWVAAVGGPAASIVGSVIYAEYKDRKNRRNAVIEKSQTDKEEVRRIDLEQQNSSTKIAMDAYRDQVNGWKDQLAQTNEMHRLEVARMLTEYEQRTAWLSQERIRLEALCRDQIVRINQQEEILKHKDDLLENMQDKMDSRSSTRMTLETSVVNPDGQTTKNNLVLAQTEPVIQDNGNETGVADSPDPD